MVGVNIPSFRVSSGRCFPRLNLLNLLSQRAIPPFRFYHRGFQVDIKCSHSRKHYSYLGSL